MSRMLTVVGALVALSFAAALFLTNQTAHALTITVDSLADTVADDDECTLREAIENANDTTDGQPHDDCAAGDPDGEDTIQFSVEGTIVLDGSALPDVVEPLVIDGDGEITIDADGASRILSLDDDAGLTLTALEFTGGDAAAADGGALLVVSGELQIGSCSFTANSARDGGAIFVTEGTVAIAGSAFDGNSAEGDGGAISFESGTFILTGSNFSDNSAAASGGAIRTLIPLDLSGGSFVGNSALLGGAIDASAAMEVGGGTVFNDNSAAAGGAIHTNAPLEIGDVLFTSNSATSEGGAIAAEAALAVAGGTFIGNSASDAGGAIFSEDPIQVTGSALFQANTAAIGGAIDAEAGLQVTGATFTGNFATAEGGAILSLGALTITNATFRENDATNGGAIDHGAGGLTIAGSLFDDNAAVIEGGAIRVSLSAVDAAAIETTTFTDNHALAGGAILISAGAVDIADSTFHLNSVTSQGGAILNSGELTLTNSTISTNAADTGGGGLFNAGEATVLNVTFAANSALGDDAGGIVNQSAASLQITNSLVTLGNLGINCELAGTLDGVDGSNLSDDDSCDTDLFDEVADLMLEDLADNGGPTDTHLPEPESPAIDAGDDAACPDTDQRGEERIALNNCDVGSVEVQDVPFVPSGDQFVPGITSQRDHQ